MNTQTMVVVLVALVVLAAIAWVYASERRSRQLRTHFGPEYDRALQERGGRREAERELERRAKRVERLTIRPLPATLRTQYLEQWRSEQARFVDDPKGAVAAADRLVMDVMVQRGYPVGDFDQRAADVSVDHPRVVENYRAAHDIALRVGRGEASTEDMRKAMVHYRALFEDLLQDTPAEVRK